MSVKKLVAPTNQHKKKELEQFLVKNRPAVFSKYFKSR